MRNKWLWYAISIILLTWLLALWVYPSLPERVATHFNLEGEPDGWSNRFWGAFGLVFFQAALTFFSWGLVVLFRQTGLLLPARYGPQIERQIYIVAACVNMMLLLIALIIWEFLPQSGWTVALSLSPAIAGVIYVLYDSARLGIQALRQETEPGKGSADELQHWKWGLFYYNKKDPSLFVDKKVGVGLTFNFARPLSWVILMVMLLPAVVVLLIAIWL